MSILPNFFWVYLRAGLGGKNISKDEITAIYKELKEISENNAHEKQAIRFVGVEVPADED